MAFSYRDHLIRTKIGSRFKMLDLAWFSHLAIGDIIELLKIESELIDGVNPYCNFRRLARPELGRPNDDDAILLKRRLDESAMERLFCTIICQKHF